jgi:hypothetical protein
LRVQLYLSLNLYANCQRLSIELSNNSIYRSRQAVSYSTI